MYRELHDAYRITSYKHVPAGKLNEALTFLGLREPELDEMVLVRKRDLIKQPVESVSQPAFSIPNNMVVISVEQLIDLKKHALPLQLADLKFFVEQSGGLVLMKDEVDKMKGVLKA